MEGNNINTKYRKEITMGLIVKEKYKLDICIDCVYYNEYGHIGDEHEECACETCIAVRKGFTKLGEEHGSYDIASNQDEALVEFERIPFFSWQPCDICESHLGGNRYEVNLLILESE